jgi:cystathionine beta-lyase/cystathionine gamma-synthase
VSLDRSTTHPYEEGEPGPFYYQRNAHPAGVEAERALGELEGGHALLYASGAGAVTGVALALLAPGDTVALADGAYYGTGVLLRQLGRWGLEVVEFDQRGPAPDGAALVWLEAPSNPHLTFPDIASFAGRGARVLVDATASTPVLLRPLEHGADLVLHSATKYLGGHHDLLLGAVVAREQEVRDRLLAFRNLAGITAAPDPCWLLLRSLPTLELRVRRQSETALELARRLAGHPGVERVLYPGLGDEVAARYLDGGFGGMLSFEVKGDARAVETSTRAIENATSLGGVRSNIETRHRWEPERVSPGSCASASASRMSRSSGPTSNRPFRGPESLPI